MEPSNALPFPTGSSSATTSLSGLLGRHFLDSSGRRVRLMRAKTALTSPAKKAVLNTITAGAYNNKVTLAATTDSPDVAGIADPSLSGNLAANDFFYVYDRAGDVVQVITTVTTVAAGDLLGTHTTTAGTLRAVVTGAAATAGTEGEIRQARRAVAIALAVPTTTASKVINAKLIGAFA